jgi:DNA-binding SARP family transcriptional activator
MYFLGKSKIEYNDELLEDNLGNKATALLCLLVLKDKGYLSREKLVSYLWPDSYIEAARYNLRYNLWLIKKNIGTDEKGNSFLRIDNEFCSINKEYEFNCDIFQILKFKPSKNDTIEGILKIKKLFRGDLLEGCFFKKCEELNDLIIYERINFERRKVKILKRLVDLYELEEKYEYSIEIINEILEIEPYDEEMILKLMDIYSLSGKRAAAINYYNNYSNGLAGSLGISPSDGLKNKYNEIKSKRDEHYKNFMQKERIIDCKQKTKLIITSDCMKNIDYFWLSDVIGKLLKNIDEGIIKSLNYKEILDLGYIQSDILQHCEHLNSLQEYNREVKDVCIINSFIKLISNVCNKQDLTILITNSTDMDEISHSVIEYIKRLQISGLQINEKS